MQLQLLTEREIVPYQIRAADSAKLPMSNIYGHQMRIVNDLRTEEFKQYWKQLSLSKKQAIVMVSEKELNMQIKESVYWFSLRYAMESLPPEMITEEKMSEMIDFAAMYDRCVMPGSSSKPSQLFNELESEAFYSCQKKPEEIGIHYCIHRFKMFLYWLLCNHMDEAFQMHKKEEEADREAALLLKEPVDKEKKKTRKKKRNKKAAATTATTTSGTSGATSSVTTPTIQSSIQTQTTAVEKPKEEKATISGKEPSNEENQKKEEKMAKTASTSSSKTSLSSQSSSLQKNLEPDRTTLPIPPPSPPSLEAQRISRLLLGDGSEGAANDRKRGKPEVTRSAFISLRQLLLRKDPLEEILRNSAAKRTPNVPKSN